MRKIKFRGRTSIGEIHYGHYTEYPVGNGRINSYITDEDLDEWVVARESVAQLIGYDAEGNEVYEGDKVIHFTGEEVTVRLSGETDTYSYLGIAGEKFDDCKLKKE